MDETLADVEQDLRERKAAEKGDQDATPAKSKKHKYRKDKPWDNDKIDHWKIESFSNDDNPSGLLEESSFATLFPQYREQYLKQTWPDVKACLDEHGIRAELDLVEGSMSVKTTKKTFDPFIIIKARDLMKLLARSVPFPQAKKILDDEMFCDIIKTKSYVRSKDKFVKRRQRLVGPNGSTLKAIELLTECYVLVQGQTCCVMGKMKGIKAVRKIVEDCFHNIHPVYHIKELMIKRELEKDETLKEEDWSRFLPKFKKRNVQTKKLKKKFKKKKEKSLFPPEQEPRKEDLQMESGEYFLSDAQKQMKAKIARQEQQAEVSATRKRDRLETFVPKSENLAPSAKRAKIETEKSSSQGKQVSELADKLKKKKSGEGKKKKAENALL